MSKYDIEAWLKAGKRVKIILEPLDVLKLSQFVSEEEYRNWLKRDKGVYHENKRTLET